ncbi:MAG: hypothetical protein M3160_00195 [Candidatus Eremiobacteraeota bacterium]|nr:hypothetical protein [Candidatus Eremiobacteraeota bacterium]
MEISTLLNILSTMALVGALLFAGLQLRSANRVRSEQAAITLIETALSAILTRPLGRIAEVSPNARAADLKAYGPDIERAIQEIGFRLETVGYLVYRRVATLESVEDLMGGMVTFWWARIKPFAERDRELTGNPRMYEWVQWLAERVADGRSGSSPEPAFLRYADWR